jgi:phosphonate degradation associated HDIG domain protein
MTGVIPRVRSLFAGRGATAYLGEPVTQLEHALQAAWSAEKLGAPAEWVAAVLLHDVGHLLHEFGDRADDGIDDCHEELGYRFLAKFFPPAVAEPVRLHVPAKRYLCTVEPGYAAGLSPASVTSLSLQGGPMPADEATEFETHPHFRATVAVRRWDDAAKVPGLATPPFDHFLAYEEQALAPH